MATSNQVSTNRMADTVSGWYTIWVIYTFVNFVKTNPKIKQGASWLVFTTIGIKIYVSNWLRYTITYDLNCIARSIVKKYTPYKKIRWVVNYYIYYHEPKFSTSSSASECMTSTNIASDGSKRTKVGMSLNKGEAGSSPEILPIFLFVNVCILSPAYPAMCAPKECPIMWKSSILASWLSYENICVISKRRIKSKMSLMKIIWVYSHIKTSSSYL